MPALNRIGTQWPSVNRAGIGEPTRATAFTEACNSPRPHGPQTGEPDHQRQHLGRSKSGSRATCWPPKGWERGRFAVARWAQRRRRVARWWRGFPSAICRICARWSSGRSADARRGLREPSTAGEWEHGQFPFPLQYIAHRGACGKTGVMLQNRWPRTKIAFLGVSRCLHKRRHMSGQVHR
jgi:hypothetical protein